MSQNVFKPPATCNSSAVHAKVLFAIGTLKSVRKLYLKKTWPFSARCRMACESRNRVKDNGHTIRYDSLWLSCYTCSMLVQEFTLN